MSENLSEQYPSLRLAYEQVRDILVQQRQTARDYGMKAITLLAVATAIAGIGIPLGFSKGLETIYLFGQPATGVVIIPIILYAMVVYCAYKTYKLAPIKTMNEPKIIRESFSVLNQDKFLYEMLLHTEIAFLHNAKIIREKEKTLKPLLPLVIMETAAIILWSGLILKIIS